MLIDGDLAELHASATDALGRLRVAAYYDHLTAVRTTGDWEGWTAFFLASVREAADDAVEVAGPLARLVADHRTLLPRPHRR